MELGLGKGRRPGSAATAAAAVVCVRVYVCVRVRVCGAAGVRATYATSEAGEHEQQLQLHARRHS